MTDAQRVESLFELRRDLKMRKAECIELLSAFRPMQSELAKYDDPRESSVIMIRCSIRLTEARLQILEEELLQVEAAINKYDPLVKNQTEI